MQSRIRKVSFYLIAVLMVYSSSLSAQNETVIKNGNKLYISNTVVIKQKGEAPAKSLRKTTNISSSLMQKLKPYGVSSVQQTFETGDNALGNITTIKYSSTKDPMTVASELEKSGEVLWAEPHYIYKMSKMPEMSQPEANAAEAPMFPAPNDPSYGNQWWLTKIQAQPAWDVNSGDTNVVIAIVDCGVQWDHADLSKNMWTNRKEIPGNGIDDDGNGYVDDVRGWDFGGLTGVQDNNPTEDKPQHGTHVAGIASAVSNNGIGIASIGYKCRLMAVKTSRNDRLDENGDAYIWYGYEGIVYAAASGANIINCSWGGPSYSRAGQDAVNYALSKGSLVVVAAGNDGYDLSSYPAAYDGVLCVASTNNSDRRSYFSNYGTYVTVCAPGESIYSTWQPGSYSYLSGTSMATPLTAGLAGLVKSQFPQYNPRQIAEQIRVNCDNIDASNSAFQYQLGGGRINALKALSNTASKSVRAIDVKYTDEAPGGNGNGIFEPGETITVSVKFMNYLNPVSGLTISLESRSLYAQVVKGSFTSGSVGTLTQFDNSSAKFTFKITNDVVENSTAKFLIKYSDNGSYSDFQWTSVLLRPSYGDMQAGSVRLTVTGKGTLAYNDFPDNTQGSGFVYKDGPNLLFEGSLMYGNQSSKIANGARFMDYQDTSFTNLQPFIMQVPGTIADYQGQGVFNDSRTPSDSYGIETKLNTFAYANPPDDKYIILKYTFTNKSGADLPNFYAGIFYDWDINADSAEYDAANYDAADNFGYAYSTLKRPAVYAGSALISADKFNYYAARNDGGDGGVGIYYQSGTTMNGYTKAEKWTTLTSGLNKKTASGGDISMVVSAGPYSIPAGKSIDVAFAVAAGDNLEDLRGAIKTSRTKYQQILLTGVDDNGGTVPDRFALDQNYPNPFNPSTSITYQTPQDGSVKLEIYNLLGEKVAGLVNGSQSKGIHKVQFDSNRYGLTTGVYFYRLEFGSQVISRKMILLK